MKFMSLALIMIGWSSQIFLSWYQLMRNFVASSLRVLKLSMIGVLRYDLIYAVEMFLTLSEFDQSLISAQYLGQLCLSNLPFLILLRCYSSADSFFSSSATFFLASVVAWALAFATSLMLPCIFGAMFESSFFDSVDWDLGVL